MALASPQLTRERACALVGLSVAATTNCSVRDPPASVPRPSAPRPSVPRRSACDRIEELCLEFPRYGYRRVTAQLRREDFPVNHKRVQRIMQEECLRCVIKKRLVKTTDSQHGYRRYPNLLRGLTVTHLDQVWVADFTYIRLREQFVYLAALLDAFSRKVIGWELAAQPTAGMCLRALRQALTRRQPAAGFIHHSDQGVQYASTEYTALLQERSARISMARRGNPYDNAQVESFIKTLKREEVHLVEYRDEPHARERLGYFLETVYNRKRLHSSLGYLPSTEFEAQQ